MKATVTTSDLRAAALFCQKSAQRIATIDALKCFRLHVAEGMLTIQATDLNTWASATVACESATDGVSIVPAADFVAFCKAAPSKGSVTLVLGERSLSVSADGVRATLPIGNPVEFPEAKAPPEMQEVDPSLAEAMKAALPAVFSGRFETSSGVDGLYFDTDQVVGYDNKRLTVAQAPCPEGVIIPREHVLTITSLIENGGKFGSDGRLWAASSSGMQIVGRCRDAQYPPYRKNMEHPEVDGAPIVARFSRDSMIEAVRRATLSDARAIKIEGNGKLTVSTFLQGPKSKLTAEGEADCDGEVVEEFAAHIESKFALDALSSMPDADIVLARKSTSPQILIFRPADRSAFLDRTALISELRA